MMNSSYYNIYKKVDAENNLYMVINAYTHALDIISQNVYNYLVRKGEESTILDESKEKLIKRGFLTNLSNEEEMQLVNQISINDFDKKLHKNLGFYFVLSYDCNFRCTYCYESNVLRDSKSTISKKIITKEYVDKAFEIISEKLKDGHSSRTVHLYGGEPFLKENREIICYIFQKAKELNLFFSAISNGYDLDNYFDLIESYKSIQFQITIDGVRDIHNVNRPHFNYEDSFNKVTDNIDSLLKMGIHVSVRMNTSSDSVNRLNEILLFFKEKGWLDLNCFRCYASLLRPEVKYANELPASDYSYFNLMTDFNKVVIDKSFEDVECQDFGVYKVLSKLLLGGKIPYRSAYCGAQNNTIIFDPKGNIYSCWDVVGQEDYVAGRYIPELSYYNTASEKWLKPGVSNQKCLKCKFVLFCGGGCFAASLRKSGELELGTCNDYPRLFRFMMKELYEKKIKNTL